MNIGSSTNFNSVINSFHSTVAGTTFYTNSSSGPPPPDPGLYGDWLGYDGATPSVSNGTFYFSLNGKDVVSPVSQGFMEMTSLGPDSVRVTKSSGYSGNPTTIIDKIKLKAPYSGTHYFRFQSDNNVSMKVFEINTPDSGDPGFKCWLVTQTTLTSGMILILPEGSYSYFGLGGLPVGNYDIEGPVKGDLDVTVVSGEQSGPWEHSDTLGPIQIFYVLHDPTVALRRTFVPLQDPEFRP